MDAFPTLLHDEAMETKIKSNTRSNAKSIVVVGVGSQVRNDYLPVLNSNKYNVALYDNNLTSINKALSTYCNTKTVENIDFVSSDNTDLAIIATPHNSHFKYEKYFLNKGIQVLVEKPLAIKYKEAETLKSFSNLQVALKRRYFQSFIDARILLANGLIGELKSYSYRYILGLSTPASGWRLNKNISGGGCVIDMGYHAIDTINLFFGMPKHIFAATNNYQGNVLRGIENDVHITSIHKKICGSLFISRPGVKKVEELIIIGTRGALILTPETIQLSVSSIGADRSCKTYTNHHVMSQMIEDILNNRSKLGKISEQIQNMKIIDLIYESLERNKNVIA